MEQERHVEEADLMKGNQFDRVVDRVVQEMHKSAKALDTATGDPEPFDSHRLTPQESLFFYDHPHAHPDVQGLTDPTTGLPYGNEQAAAALLEQWGPVRYVDWVDENHAYQQKQGESMMGEGMPE